MKSQILKAHALVAQKKLSHEDFFALLIGLLVGNRRLDYQTYIRSAAWKQKADAAKKRAGYRCQVCNNGPREGAQLDAHHRTYERLGHEEPEDITVLCHECHELFSTRML